MSRSVVLRKSPRCARCQFPARWCTCAGFHEISCPLAIDVLVHSREAFRPSSTGRLINRVIPASGARVFRRGAPLNRADFVRLGRELWILHPVGEPMPTGASPAAVQVLLLDGSWREAARMRTETQSWGRAVSLRVASDGQQVQGWLLPPARVDARRRHGVRN